jgi:hypothetical protein
VAEAAANAEHSLKEGRETEANLRHLEAALDAVVHAIRSKLGG